MAKKTEIKTGPHAHMEEALRLKSLAEHKFNASNLQSALKYANRAHTLCPSAAGVAEMLTAYRTLAAAKPNNSNSVSDFDSPDWYKILDLEPFSPINAIKKQYKKLALILHPDKNSLHASNDAFKLVNDAFHVLSDRIRRKEYDMKLRIAIQSAAMENGGCGDEDVFWTICSRCKLRHKFEKKFIGQNLVCPSCRKSFQAMDVQGETDTHIGGAGDEEEEDSGGDSLRRRRFQGQAVVYKRRKKTSRVTEVLERSHKNQINLDEEHGLSQRAAADTSERLVPCTGMDDEDMTLADFKRLRKPNEDKKSTQLREKPSKEKKMEDNSLLGLVTEDMEIVTVEDSDFYDFDKDRVERSFRKGQVWAIYDDVDGMPRRYGFIDEVVSLNPFELTIRWLEPLRKGGEGRMMHYEGNTWLHFSCGVFKISGKDTMNLVNIFSHMVSCERTAREIYWIYPTKGSVWALYNEENVDAGENPERQYDIGVLLTSYSEMYGLSLVYLEKVDGFKSVFKRRDFGPSAVRWLRKEDVWLFSHQIPARNLCGGDDFPDNVKNCWELDPAALPSYLLRVKSARG